MKRNVNPKTLKGQDKLNRMLDLMGRMKTLNESKSFSELELIKKGPNGVVYGIIRENHDYFIKTSNKNSGKFLAEDFNYIGGLQNKNDEKYNSYAEALKHLNIKFDMLNESYGIESNTNIFESDGRTFGGGFGFGFVMEDEDVSEEKIISDNDEEIEEQKKVLKVDAPASEEPVEDEVTDEFGDTEETDEFDDTEETDEFDDTEETDEFGDDDKDDNTKKIQKYTGKIGQMLRDMRGDEVDSDLEKYVINSIISAMHLDVMDDGDKEDIIAKLEGDEEEGDTETEDMVDLDTDETEDIVDIDLDASEESEETEEVGDMSESKVFSKKQLLESFLRGKNKNLRKRNIKESRTICEECMGSGCSSCLNEHHNMTYTNYGKFDRDEYMVDEELIGNQYKLDKNRNRRIDAEDFKMLRKSRRDRRRNLDEDEMTVFDAIKTGQGYLPTGDLDRDFDGIPNRLDLDSNSDGRLDYSTMGSGRYKGDEDFIELDIDFLRNNNPGTKERTTTTPTTRPGEKDKWRTVIRPKVDPRPKAENPSMDDLDIDFLRNNNPGTEEETITTPTTRPGEKPDKWRTIKRPKVDPRPKAENPSMDDMGRTRPSYRRRGMFR